MIVGVAGFLQLQKSYCGQVVVDGSMIAHYTSVTQGHGRVMITLGVLGAA